MPKRPPAGPFRSLDPLTCSVSSGKPEKPGTRTQLSSSSAPGSASGTPPVRRPVDRSLPLGKNGMDFIAAGSTSPRRVDPLFHSRFIPRWVPMAQGSKRWRSWFCIHREPSRPRRRPWLAFDRLEDRLVPAGDITITTLPTQNITVTDNAGVRTFQATTNNAVLSIDDIQNALVIDDMDVVVDTGPNGNQAGMINWEDVADLELLGMDSSHLLRLNLDPSGFQPVLTLSGDIQD